MWMGDGAALILTFSEKKRVGSNYIGNKEEKKRTEYRETRGRYKGATRLRGESLAHESGSRFGLRRRILPKVNRRKM